MENNIDISILMATRNPNPRYICECLQSIDQQTYKNFELVIVDDASDKVEISDFLEGYDFPIQILRNEDQLGLAKSLNKGLKLARGKYVARIDDDDLMMPNRLEKQIKIAKEHFGFVHSIASVIDADGNILRETEVIVDIKEKLKRSGNCLIHSSLFVEKTILNELGGYNGNYVFAQDYELYMKAIDRFDFYLINEPLVKYRMIEGRNSYEKKALSRMYSFVADAGYFRKYPLRKNRFLFWGRVFILIRTLYGYTFKDK